jgi:hypothetical protein
MRTRYFRYPHEFFSRDCTLVLAEKTSVDGRTDSEFIFAIISAQGGAYFFLEDHFLNGNFGAGGEGNFSEFWRGVLFFRVLAWLVCRICINS